MVKKARILIAEDEALVAEDLKMALSKIGYDVMGHAVSADEAVTKAVEHEPDLILMDIVLKGERSGIDASYDIKAKNDIPILFLTAYTDITLINKAKSTEPYTYLVKPFQERQLLAARTIEQPGFVKEYPVNLRNKYGSICNTLITSVVLKDQTGIVTGYQGSIHDITECKRAENLIKASLKEKEGSYSFSII